MKSWHSIDFSEVLMHLNTQKNGLSDKAIQELLKIYGDNSLKETIKKNFFISFISQFNHLLIYVLLISAVISGIMRHWVDMFVINERNTLHQKIRDYTWCNPSFRRTWNT